MSGIFEMNKNHFQQWNWCLKHHRQPALWLSIYRPTMNVNDDESIGECSILRWIWNGFYHLPSLVDTAPWCKTVISINRMCQIRIIRNDFALNSNWICKRVRQRAQFQQSAWNDGFRATILVIDTYQCVSSQRCASVFNPELPFIPNEYQIMPIVST